MDPSLRSAEEDIRLLDELSGLAMALARDLQACALAATDTGEKTSLALSFERTARSVRQSIAWKTRLIRDRTKQDRQDAVHAEEAREAATKRRKAQVRLHVERAIWSEAEDDEFAELQVCELDDRLDAAALEPGFAEADVGCVIARLCKALKLEPGHDAAVGGAAGQEEGDGPDEPLRQSSA